MRLSDQRASPIATIADDETVVNDDQDIVNELRAYFVRGEDDYSTSKTTFRGLRADGKIQDTEKAKAHTMPVIGGRDLGAGNVSVRLHGKGKGGAKLKGAIVADILAMLKERRA